jgi:Ca2+-binding RTX toxin-like protein
MTPCSAAALAIASTEARAMTLSSAASGKTTSTGGLGADLFKFNSIAETGITKGLRDVIKDFDVSQGDKIDLSGIDADTNVADDQAFNLPRCQKGAFFQALFKKPGELYFDRSAHILYGNNDADNEADFSIQLVGVNSLSMDAFNW